jgi:hypothetical protein
MPAVTHSPPADTDEVGAQWACAACGVEGITARPHNGTPVVDGPVCADCNERFVIASRLAAAITCDNTRMTVGYGKSVRGRTSLGYPKAAFVQGCIVLSGTVADARFVVKLVVDITQGVVRLVPATSRGMTVRASGTVIRFDHEDDLPFWMEIDVAPMMVEM